MSEKEQKPIEDEAKNTEINAQGENKQSSGTEKAKKIGKWAAIASPFVAGIAAFSVMATSHSGKDEAKETSDALNPSTTYEQVIDSTTTTAAETTTKTAETMPTVESLELNESLISDPEALAKGFFNILTEWDNAGCTKENAKAFLSCKDGIDASNAYLENVASDYDAIFENALLSKDTNGQPVAVLQNWVNTVEASHLQTLETYSKTSRPDMFPEDKEPYMRSTAFVKVVSFNKNADGSYTLVATVHEYDNSDKNRGAELNGGSHDSGETSPAMTFIVQDGCLKLSSMVRGN